jgi:transposase
MTNSKSEKRKTINEKTLIVALDIGKNIHYGYFRTPQNMDIKPFKIHNTGQSFKCFWEKLCKFKQRHGLEEVVVGFESTGPYAEPIANYLRQKPVSLVQVNPMHTKRIKELTGNSPNKTDRKDPRVIADVITLGHALTVVVPEGAAAHLRRLTHAREGAMKRKTAMLNQLQNLAFVIFPELGNLIKPASKTGLYLLKEYADPEHIVALGIEAFKDIIRKVSRGRYSVDRSEALYAAAKDTVGITQGKESIVFEINHLVSNIERESTYIEGLEEQMAQYLSQIPYSRSILSLKGIGKITVAGLVGEVGDFRKFKTISEITKLAGLDLFEVSSGKHKGVRRISKRGRALMRKLLFFAALNAVKSHGIMQVKYHTMLDNGTSKLKALVAVSRKLLRIIFALARDNTEYDEHYGREHKYKLAA